MRLLQDINLLQMASTASEAEKTILSPKAQTADSIHQALRDSLNNLDASQFHDVITGQNTIVKDAISSLVDMTLSFIPKLIGALIILWLGFKLSKVLKKAIVRMLERRNADPSLKTFLSSFVDVLLRILVIIMAMDVVGIKATSFIAVLGAMGLALGMAMQGTLQNFAGGVILLLLRPFKVGDYIECGVYKGFVTEIRIFHTFIRPFNGRIIVVPNSELSNKSLINHTREEVIRMTVTVGVAYGTDLKKAKEVLLDFLNNDPLVQQEPKPPIVYVSDLADSSVNISMWIWLKVEDYWAFDRYVRETVYDLFNANGIEIPFPQITVHKGE